MTNFYRTYIRIGRTTTRVFPFRAGYAFATKEQFFHGYDSEAAANVARSREIATLSMSLCGVDSDIACAIIESAPAPSPPNDWVGYCRIVDSMLPGRWSGGGSAHAAPPKRLPLRHPQAREAYHWAAKRVGVVVSTPACRKRPYAIHHFGYRGCDEKYRQAPGVRDYREAAKARTERVVQLALERLGWSWATALAAIKYVGRGRPPHSRLRSDSLFNAVVEVFGPSEPPALAAVFTDPANAEPNAEDLDAALKAAQIESGALKCLTAAEERPSTSQLDPELEALLS